MFGKRGGNNMPRKNQNVWKKLSLTRQTICVDEIGSSIENIEIFFEKSIDKIQILLSCTGKVRILRTNPK